MPSILLQLSRESTEQMLYYDKVTLADAGKQEGN